MIVIMYEKIKNNFKFESCQIRTHTNMFSLKNNLLTYQLICVELRRRQRPLT